MSKTAIVYWSGSGNTEAMAKAVAKGISDAGAVADLFAVSDFDSSKLSDYTGFAFGCPAMGSENLEDSEFEPVWDSVKDSLGDKKVVLFGSYGWGDGEWMRNWEESAPCEIIGTYICADAPGPDEEAACRALGAKTV